jgi:outer membrane protein assembly factor BamB
MSNFPKLYTSSMITGFITSFFAMTLLFSWVLHDPTADFKLQLPGQDNAAQMRAENVEIIRIGEVRQSSQIPVPIGYSGDWSQFRGDDKSNIKHAGLTLAEIWPESGPPVKWMVSLGEGHAAAAIHKGKVFVLDYDETLKADMLRCLSLETGEEIWRTGYRVKIKRNHGISRTVPAVTDDYVVTIGPRCHVMCVRTDTGEFVWGLDLEAEYGTQIPFWYTGQCPYVVNNKLILATGGKALLVGIELSTGKVLWECPNENDWKMSHASVIPMELSGKKMFVYPAIGGVVGVSADPKDEGRLLWQTNMWNHSVVAPSAVQLDSERIFLTAGYGAGSMVLRVNHDSGSGFSITVDQEYEPKEGLASEQQTPILFDGYLFGIQPKDAGGSRNQMICVNPMDCTDVLWSSGKQRRFGLGPYLIADGKIYILDDDGVLTMIEATSTGYHELGQFPIIPDGSDAWGPLALADGYMILRDSTKMLCVDVAKQRLETTSEL